jgi:hypothetical protein
MCHSMGKSSSTWTYSEILDFCEKNVLGMNTQVYIVSPLGAKKKNLITLTPCFAFICMPQTSGTGQNFTWTEQFLGHRCCRFESHFIKVGDRIVLNHSKGDPCIKLEVTCSLADAQPFSATKIVVEPKETNRCCHFNGLTIEPGKHALIPQKCSVVKCQQMEERLEVIISQAHNSGDCCIFQGHLGPML